ncbi:hypothetical protein [Chondromyces crocatus]|uniref:Uncharacterized protein n=1 Tax=Chondromyces crocatus TaxID=52 RepID=A0A0K1EN77_CHOCO|nr:hypothetical protein [Chondromyces crocatus]AKT42058.1 uncharacterized protein CMC5_062810 [Chondromyces crocatus]
MLHRKHVEEAGATLGLSPSGHHFEGRVDGVRVSMTDRPPPAEKTVFQLDGWLDPPLDLGLSMRRRVMVLHRRSRFSTGNEDLDDEFSLKADERARVGELFTPALRRQLVAMHRASYDIRLTDRGCTLTLQTGVGIDTAWLIQATREVVRTVDLLEAARASLGPATSLATHASVLGALAATHAMAFTTTPLTLQGALDGGPLHVGTTRSLRGRHHLALQAQFETTLGLGLFVRRRRLHDSLHRVFGAQVVRTGDAAFDKRFRVHADPTQAERLSATFDPAVREALLTLDERLGPVFVDDTAVRVAPIPSTVPPAAVREALEPLDVVRARILRNRLLGGTSSPYR